MYYLLIALPIIASAARSAAAVATLTYICSNYIKVFELLFLALQT